MWIISLRYWQEKYCMNPANQISAIKSFNTISQYVESAERSFDRVLSFARGRG